MVVKRKKQIVILSSIVSFNLVILLIFQVLYICNNIIGKKELPLLLKDFEDVCFNDDFVFYESEARAIHLLNSQNVVLPSFLKYNDIIGISPNEILFFRTGFANWKKHCTFFASDWSLMNKRVLLDIEGDYGCVVTKDNEVILKQYNSNNEEILYDIDIHNGDVSKLKSDSKIISNYASRGSFVLKKDVYFCDFKYDDDICIPKESFPSKLLSLIKKWNFVTDWSKIDLQNRCVLIFKRKRSFFGGQRARLILSFDEKKDLASCQIFLTSTSSQNNDNIYEIGESIAERFYF